MIMAFCNQCGAEIEAGAMFCSSCGVKLNGTKKTESITPSKQDQTSYNQYQPPAGYGASISGSTHVEDRVETWVYFCVFCIPIVGIVLWAVWRNERPETAKNLLIISIISFVIGFFFGLYS
jgi:hypothetical protein